DVSARLLAALRSSPNLTRFFRPAHTAAVRSLAFSSDGTLLASAGLDHTILLWDAVNFWRLTAPLKLHTDNVFSVAFRKGDKILASGSADKTIRLWNVETGEPAAQPLRLDADVHSVSFSPDGKLLASAGADGVVRLWDVVEIPGSPLQLTQRAVLGGHDGPVYMVAFSPDGRLVGSAGADKTVRLWDVRTQTVSATLKGHRGAVWSLAFSPDGRSLASGDDDSKITLWDVATRRTQSTLRAHKAAVFNVAFSPSSTKLASVDVDGRILLWDIAGRAYLLNGQQPAHRELTGYKSNVYGMAFSPAANGDVIVTGTEDGNIIRWDDPSRKWLGQGIKLDAPVHVVAFGPDNKMMATATDTSKTTTTTAASATTGDTIVLWNVTDGNLASPVPQQPFLEGHVGRITGLAFSPDGRRLASASLDGTVRRWTVATSRPEGLPLIGHRGAVNGVAFHPDGKIIASCGEDGVIILWDAASGKELPGGRLSLSNGEVGSLAFAPDKMTLASGGPNGTVVFWDLSSRRRIGDLTPPKTPDSKVADAVRTLAYSPDGKTLAFGSGSSIFVFDVVSRRQLPGSPFAQHKDKVTSLAFTLDGGVLASASLDSTIILWNLGTGRRMGPPLDEQQAPINSLAFSPDGRTLVSGSDLRPPYWSLISWDFNAKSWRSRGCQVASRSLTEEEWARWFGKEQYRPMTCPIALVMQADAVALDGEKKAAADRYAQMTAIASKTTDVDWNNYLCMFGSLDGFASIVMPACERAVTADPATEAFYRDSRGLARAMVGRYAEAADDFDAFLKWSEGKEDYEPRRPKRAAWVAALRRSQNPFDAPTLRDVRRE
ncbi:MAG: hypothetical protein C5B57_02150, partial [Blastocatellia bacterium]